MMPRVSDFEHAYFTDNMVESNRKVDIAVKILALMWERKRSVMAFPEYFSSRL